MYWFIQQALEPGTGKVLATGYFALDEDSGTLVTPYSPFLSCYEETSFASSRLFFLTQLEVGNVNHRESWATAYSGRGLVRHTKNPRFNSQ